MMGPWGVAFATLLCGAAVQALPVLLWHGMGDSSLGMAAVKQRIEASLPGVVVVAIQLGATPAQDTRAGYFGSVAVQVDGVCVSLLADARLASGFHAVGFSQGGLFVRALAQRCDGLSLRSLVTLGAPHAGVCTLPSCPPADSGVCHQALQLVRSAVFNPAVRTRVVQAQYWRGFDEDAYLAGNVFLPGLNNELEDSREPPYADRLRSLSALALFRFANDSTLVPRDSAWFSVQAPGGLLPLQSQPLYVEDWLGLRALDYAGRLYFREVPGEHMQFSLDWFDDNVIRPFLTESTAPPLAAVDGALSSAQPVQFD